MWPDKQKLNSPTVSKIRKSPKSREYAPEQDILLLYETDELLGFAWFDSPDSGDLLYRPGSDRTVIEPVFLDWLENKARSQNMADFTVGAFESDSVREDLLAARGYQKQSNFLHHMQRQLNEQISITASRQGYSVSTTTEADLPMLSTVIAAAFESDSKPISTYETLRSSRFYRNDLDVVIKSSEDEVVVFCLAWLDESNKVGLLEPVGCRPEHQQLGLASAAVWTALKRLRDAGATTAVVYPMGDTPAAIKLYSSCGFVGVADNYDWTVTS